MSPQELLDLKTGVVVLEALAAVNRELGTLTVVITHNASISQMADRIVYMSDGQIARIESNATRKSARELAW